jgi:hypothetical protein
VAWYEINLANESFNLEFSTTPRVGEEILLESDNHTGMFIVTRVVHVTADNRDDRPSTRIFIGRN